MRRMASHGLRRRAAWRDEWRHIIFEADTPAGKAFDVALLWAILASVAVVMLDSVTPIRARYGTALDAAEIAFTVLFSVEYTLRLATAHRPFRYARSFFGVVDLVAVLPTYLALVVTGAETLIVLRILRLLRVFRVFKLGRYLGEANVLLDALHSSRRKITVFLGTVVCIVVIVGSAMYLIEGPATGFTSIPRSVYWAIVTVTTVGYGDIAPQSVVGQGLAAVLMIMGYSIIAVPTGIVSAAMVQTSQRPLTTRVCPGCFSEGHARDAHFCRDCGHELIAPPEPEPSPDR
jgi:voltage-gated potassium channel